MGKILLNTANITCNNKKETDLRAYINGKTIHTINYDSKEVILEYADTDFIFLVDENMESTDDQADVSLLREIKRFNKKLKESNIETKFNDFEECITNTFSYIDGLEESGEIAPRKRFVSSALISYDKALLITSDIDSALYITGGNIVNLFSDENEGKIHTAEIAALKVNDMLMLLSSNVAKALSQNEILDTINLNDTAEENAQAIASVYASNHDDEYSVTVITVKLIQDKSRTFMRNEINTQEIETGDVIAAEVQKPSSAKFEGRSDKKESFWEGASDDIVFTDKKMRNSAKNASFETMKMGKSESKKRRTSIYLKRAISIVIVLAVMAGIIIGMVNLLKHIFNQSEVEESGSPMASISPIVVESPTPTPTPSEEITPSPSPSPIAQFVNYTVKSGDTLTKIAKYHNDLYELNYPNTNLQPLVDLIMGYNNLEDSNKIFIGQELKIPITPIP
ncbi:MAG: LysM domain-containing protein [Clostridia bacterium]|jgi:LysM repeat protein